MDEESVLSESEIMIAELRIMQSLDKDGDIHVYDLSQSNDGSDLEPAKALELLEWARASIIAPMIYNMMQCIERDDEDSSN